MSALVWSLPAVPLVTGAALVSAGRRGDRAAPVAGVSAAALSLGLAIAAAFVRPSAMAPFIAGAPAGLAVDGLSAVMVVTVTAVTFAVLVYSVGEFGPEEARARFFGLMLLFAGSMLVTVTATTLPLLLMAWEVMGATSYALIGFWWREPRRVDAATTAFLTTRAGDLGLYIAAGAALAGTGTLVLDQLPQASSGWRHVIAAGVVVAALGKSAQLPFSFWLSRAMEGPSPVSALLHSATMVAAGAYLLLRLQPLLAATGWAGPLVAWAGAVTALVLGAIAIAQPDLKQLLAASTCAQIGFMVLAAGAAGVGGGVAHLVGHAATKSLLFLVAGVWLATLGAKDLERLRGAGHRLPRVGAAFTAGGLALAGLAPLSLWATKDAVLTSVWAEDSALYVVALVAALLSAVYSAKAITIVWRRSGDVEETSRDATETSGAVGGWRAAPLPVLAVIAAVLGVYAVPAVAEAFAELIGSPATEPAGWQLLLSAVLALAAVLGTITVVRRGVRLPSRAQVTLASWLGLERAAHLLLVRPAFALAHALARFDDRVVDRGVDIAADAVHKAARLADLRAEHPIDAVVGAVAGAFRGLGRLARRPQTGQLHAYYAQAAALFAVLAVILVLVR
ncbi:NADH-quinone oxidoreductase subunit 5 family protein [Actinomadura rudentiformis]|uniref:NADH-quinone oxidoreductase subunit L n=1 Tax=Actinomadura rudentiformis TaxID=359158 RepID=A0A6H9YZQ2_9ACTN|nr:proton-conducting transporter membrane subunit [Actinomadura rudentiformis]KAB2346939.1 NADH-quinone oxidoreductase subunit L [Actinomadura rudentiformis]